MGTHTCIHAHTRETPTCPQCPGVCDVLDFCWLQGPYRQTQAPTPLFPAPAEWRGTRKEHKMVPNKYLWVLFRTQESLLLCQLLLSYLQCFAVFFEHSGSDMVRVSSWHLPSFCALTHTHTHEVNIHQIEKNPTYPNMARIKTQCL